MATLSPGLVVLLVIIIAPIIPSYLLFKFLPSTAVGSGPFQGLRVNLSGGFAGYFLVLLMLLPIRGSFITSYDKWTVTGRIVDADGNIIKYLDPRFVTYSGRSMKSDQSGNFTLEFVTTSDGEYSFPDLYIHLPGYLSKDLFLGPKDQDYDSLEDPSGVDSKNKFIRLGTIKLQKDPNYRAVSCAPPQPQAAPVSQKPLGNPLLAAATEKVAP